MAKQNLLVVDADPRSLRVLEVSLRNAGYNVAGCPSVGKAFEILHANKPDLILSDTAFADMNGFDFVEQLRQNSDWADIPFMFLSSDGSIESKIRGLELGVQDYLTKPIYIREVIARVGIELARQTRAGLALKSTDARTRFSGSLSEMSVVDLLQTIDVSRKSGVLTLVASDGQEGMISFDSGAVINAAVEDLRGEDAIYRQLLWREGHFDLEFRRVSLSERTVHRTTQALLMEGMRRLDEWSRLLELLPSFDAVLEIDAEMLRERLRDIPDEQNEMIKLIDGKRTVGEALRAHGGDHVEALRKVVDLYFEGLVREAGRVQESIPVVAEAFVHASAPPPNERVNTIPGPVGTVAREIAVPAAPSVPDAASTSEHSDRITPVSLPSSKLHATDISDDEITAPRATSAPPPSAQEAWQPAPPPAPSSRARLQTPRGFQQARPEASMYAGGTILNWAGRVPQIDEIGDISGRETVELGKWDDTLSALRDDPDVEDAIEAIDSDPPPAPFVRSSPPSSPPPPAAAAQATDSTEPHALPDPSYEEPPEVDPPPLTYEQVFEQPPHANLEAPRALDPSSLAARRSPAPPTLLPWVLVAAIVCGVGAVAFVLSQRREPAASAPAPATLSESVSESAPPSVPTPTSSETVQASGSDPGVDTGTDPEPGSKTTPPTEPAPPTTASPDTPPSAAPVENPEVIYPETGAPDTYEAQLALARRLKRGARADAAYRRAIALNPQGSDALAELARLMLARQHTREATELAERATAIDPSNALGWVTLGAARQMRGDRQGARQAYQSCVKLGRGGYVSECRAMLR